MLCPVCNVQPLKGKQTTCSAKCRSAKYRAQKQKREASQRAASTTSTTTEARRPRGRPTMEHLAQLVSSEVDRIVAVIQQLGELKGSTSTAHRVDLREQVTSQAPEGAVGYRLVLPSRVPGDVLRLSPRRSRSRKADWYSLSPFEYPDDLRLCDGTWYRIVWIDAQGQRMRLRPDQEIPALYYFVGAPETESTESLVERAMALADQSLADSSTIGEGHSPTAARLAMPPSSVLASFPASLLSTVPDSDRATLSTILPLSSDESRVVLRFVQQPDWLVQLLHEDRAATARATGQPMPTEPPISLSHDERKSIGSILEQRPLRPFVLLCKLLHAYARKHGPEALNFLPTPLPPLLEADVQRIRIAVSDPQQRTYLEYLRARQESLLHNLPLPDEPTVTPTGKVGQQLRRISRDTRQIMLFEDLTRPRFTALKRCAPRRAADCDAK